MNPLRYLKPDNENTTNQKRRTETKYTHEEDTQQATKGRLNSSRFGGETHTQQQTTRREQPNKNSTQFTYEEEHNTPNETLDEQDQEEEWDTGHSGYFTLSGHTGKVQPQNPATGNVSGLVQKFQGMQGHIKQIYTRHEQPNKNNTQFTYEEEDNTPNETLDEQNQEEQYNTSNETPDEQNQEEEWDTGHSGYFTLSGHTHEEQLQNPNKISPTRQTISGHNETMLNKSPSDELSTLKESHAEQPQSAITDETETTRAPQQKNKGGNKRSVSFQGNETTEQNKTTHSMVSSTTSANQTKPEQIPNPAAQNTLPTKNTEQKQKTPPPHKTLPQIDSYIIGNCLFAKNGTALPWAPETGDYYTNGYPNDARIIYIVIKKFTVQETTFKEGTFLFQTKLGEILSLSSNGPIKLEIPTLHHNIVFMDFSLMTELTKLAENNSNIYDAALSLISKYNNASDGKSNYARHVIDFLVTMAMFFLQTESQDETKQKEARNFLISKFTGTDKLDNNELVLYVSMTLSSS